MKLMTWRPGIYKVFVYRNLHQQCWSVKSLYGRHYGRVILHCTAVDLSQAFFKVNEKGRQRVLDEKSKNVHAGVVGYLEGAHVLTERYTELYPANVIHDHVTGWAKPDNWDEVTYNPYKFDSFVYSDNHNPATGEFHVMLCDDMTVLATKKVFTIAA